MPHLFSLRPALSALLVLGVLLVAPACDSSDPEEEPEVIPPSFDIASESFTTANGEQGIQFFIVPNANVTLTGLGLTDPRGRGETVPVQNLVIRAGAEQALQPDDQGYPRVSGTWRFTFEGFPTAAPLETFTVVETLNVGAFAPDGPTE